MIRRLMRKYINILLNKNTEILKSNIHDLKTDLEQYVFDKTNYNANLTINIANEFRDYLYKINQQTKNNLIQNESYSISTINGYGKEFFWVTNSGDRDPITNNARLGKVTMDEFIFGLFCNKIGVFCDLGANIGAFSLSFSALGWSGFAFEASSSNYDVLQKSIYLNNFNITAVNKAVYDKSCSIYFVQDGPWGLIKNDVYPNEKYEEIECICLDDYFNNITNEINDIDLIKIDIEGSEVAALRGMKQSLKRFHYPIIYTEVNAFALALQGETPLSYFQEAKSIGYSIYQVAEGKLYKYKIENFPKEFIGDFLFIKDIPEYVNEYIAGEVYSSEEEELTYIISKLKEHSVWNNLKAYGRESNNDEYGSYICYCLKDYPNYYLKDEILLLLKEIKESNKENYLIQKYLEWFNK